MFTGLVQSVGRIVERSATQLRVGYRPEAWEAHFELGESVAVNGCCLTVVEDTNSTLRFDLSEETWARTALGGLEIGSAVNLERAMRPIDRFGGHIVQGHVDGVGRLVAKTPHEGGIVFTFQVPDAGDRYLIDKGSIAIDGISLTVVEPADSTFDVWVIPHTMAHTTLGELEVDSDVNIEYDVLAKHVEKLLSHHG